MRNNKDNISESPLVTIYMPTYNRVELLKRAVESVLSQNYENIELIVVDDCSSDGTHQYLDDMANKDSRFRYFINDKNSGACVSRNRAIFLANGEFITGLDDDDYFLPNRISNFVESWKVRREDCIALYSNSYFSNVKDKTLRVNRIKKCSKSDLIFFNWIGNQVFTRTEWLKEINGFDENLPAWQDLECWYRLLCFNNTKAYLVPEYSYFIDASHPHERITTGKTKAILKAYSHICEKYQFNYIQRKILALQITSYSDKKPEISGVLLGLIISPRKHTLKKTLMMLYKNYIS